MKGCFKVFLGVVLGVPATIAALIALGVWWHSASVRYRLTLVVEADGHEHTGSGVLQAGCENTEWLFGGLGGSSCHVSGEAIPIDLGTRGLLFVTLHGQQVSRDVNTSPAYLPWLAFPDAGKDAEGHRSYARELRALDSDEPKADLPLTLLPLLVRFRNIANPKSVEKVDPEDLGASFGAGARIVGASVAITNDPETRGLEKVLPWLTSLSGALDGSRMGCFSKDLMCNLGVLDFESLDFWKSSRT